jgi:hypothetical protein
MFLTQIFDIRSVYEGETMYATVDALTFSHKNDHFVQHFIY